MGVGGIRERRVGAFHLHTGIRIERCQLESRQRGLEVAGLDVVERDWFAAVEENSDGLRGPLNAEAGFKWNCGDRDLGHLELGRFERLAVRREMQRGNLVEREAAGSFGQLHDVPTARDLNRRETGGGVPGDIGAQIVQLDVGGAEIRDELRNPHLRARVGFDGARDGRDSAGGLQFERNGLGNPRCNLLPHRQRLIRQLPIAVPQIGGQANRCGGPDGRGGEAGLRSQRLGNRFARSDSLQAKIGFGNAGFDGAAHAQRPGVQGSGEAARIGANKGKRGAIELDLVAAQRISRRAQVAGHIGGAGSARHGRARAQTNLVDGGAVRFHAAGLHVGCNPLRPCDTRRGLGNMNRRAGLGVQVVHLRAFEISGTGHRDRRGRAVPIGGKARGLGGVVHGGAGDRRGRLHARRTGGIGQIGGPVIAHRDGAAERNRRSLLPRGRQVPDALQSVQPARLHRAVGRSPSNVDALQGGAVQADGDAGNRGLRHGHVNHAGGAARGLVNCGRDILRIRLRYGDLIDSGNLRNSNRRPGPQHKQKQSQQYDGHIHGGRFPALMPLRGVTVGQCPKRDGYYRRRNRNGHPGTGEREQGKRRERRENRRHPPENGGRNPRQQGFQNE